MRFSLFSTAALVIALVVVACSDDPQPSSSSSGSSSGTPAPADPSFEKDVMPIFSKSCALSSCHASKQAPQPGVPHPAAGVTITNEKAVTYKALINVDSLNFKGTKLIVPGDPENSLVMRKMDGTQAELESCPGDCGKSMPPPEDEGEQLLSQKKRDTIRNWIAKGAKDN